MATIKLRQGPGETRKTFVPLTGELILDTTSNLLYVGDGVTPGGILIDNSDAPNLVPKIIDGDLRVNLDRGGNKNIFLLKDYEDVL